MPREAASDRDRATVSNFVNYPVISDDSGLCIKALGNKPGIHSARLAKKKVVF